jgi:hypothetical protein
MQIMKQLSIKGLFLPAIALCSLLLSGNAAHAALVNYSFTGGVSDVNAPLQPTVNLLSPVSGTFQFDNATGGVGGNYPGAVTNMSLNIGGYTSSFALGANAVTIFNQIDLGAGIIGDRWKLVTEATGGPINGYSPFRFDLKLDQEGGAAFNNVDLQSPPSFGTLTGSRWRLIFENADGDLVRVQGALNSLSLTAVPLPAAVLLFGAGLISLVGLGAGGLRNLRWPQV